jgi:hypothetical protein
VNTYKEIAKQIDIVSQQCLERLAITDKKQRRKDS